MCCLLLSKLIHSILCAFLNSIFQKSINHFIIDCHFWKKCEQKAFNNLIKNTLNGKRESNRKSIKSWKIACELNLKKCSEFSYE